MTTTSTTPVTRKPATTSKSAKRTEYALSALRLVSGFLFACHGAQGLGALGGVDSHGTAVPFGLWPAWWATIIELVAGVLVCLGIGTRPAAVLCSGVMAYAYFTVHQPLGLLPLQNMGEPAALYAWIFLLIAVAGPGRLALGRLLSSGTSRSSR
ncbi:DoxX family protein [Amycolatopsis acidiphila]|uniref:DoxX family protein n=1 Tax=Amycolatopsis acidiphila TaxID=715473 RepID=A0A558AGA3_9PSEU|nr:DoxX family protein [Amycolatopsis acidiphila]TVT23299.1 DoxX family protein [Amycolatopsis acidiphila]UIJ56524.1 DoxX family protein [Amycolatopsis acidiphila]GHG66819.1 integral membrane protein [Amycolatopsis acidiphila]